MLDKFFKNFQKNKQLEENKVAYRRGPYQLWHADELTLVHKQIIHDCTKGSPVNISSLKRRMPNRTLDSIKSKVREECFVANIDYSTYTEKEEF